MCPILTELELSEDFLTDGSSFKEGQVCVFTSRKGSGGVSDSPVFLAGEVLPVFTPLKFCLGFICGLYSLPLLVGWRGAAMVPSHSLTGP